MFPTAKARVSWLAIVTAAVLFLCLTLVAPLAAARGGSVAGTIAVAIYAAFDQVCHQIDTRSFHLKGHPIAVCHRCFGLYFGAVVGILVVPFWTRSRQWLMKEPRRILVFLIPMVLDWALMTHNIALSRFFTGALAAAPVAVLVFVAHEQLTARSRAVQPGDLP